MFRSASAFLGQCSPRNSLTLVCLAQWLAAAAATDIPGLVYHFNSALLAFHRICVSKWVFFKHTFKVCVSSFQQCLWRLARHNWWYPCLSEVFEAAWSEVKGPCRVACHVKITFEGLRPRRFKLQEGTKEKNIITDEGFIDLPFKQFFLEWARPVISMPLLLQKCVRLPPHPVPKWGQYK